MKVKTVLGIMVALLFGGLVTLTLNAQTSETIGTIYIRADGLVEPAIAPILNVGNVSYTFLSNINDPIVVERDNILIDGAGHILQGAGSGTGINLTSRNNVTIRNVKITEFFYGVYLDDSTNITIHGNNALNNTYGITLGSSTSTTLFDNNSSSNKLDGIFLFYSLNNVLYGNIISNNRYGIVLSESHNNSIFHNNLINNIQNHTHLYQSFNNIRDDGYPSGGNYWSDYIDVDIYSGPNQNEAGGDGICDKPYTLDVHNQDAFPLMAPISLFDVGVWNDKPCKVGIISNSTISNFQLNTTQKTLSFNVTCETSSGFCRVTIPNIVVQNLWQHNYTVLIDGEKQLNIRNWTDETSTHLYFTYSYKGHKIIIVRVSINHSVTFVYNCHDYCCPY